MGRQKRPDASRDISFLAAGDVRPPDSSCINPGPACRARTPRRENPDRPSACLDGLVFVAGDKDGFLETQFRHGLFQRSQLPLSGLGTRQGLAHLHKQFRAPAHGNDEIHFPAALRLVVEDLWMYAPQCDVDEVFQQVAGIDEYAAKPVANVRAFLPIL